MKGERLVIRKWIFYTDKLEFSVVMKPLLYGICCYSKEEDEGPCRCYLIIDLFVLLDLKLLVFAICSCAFSVVILNFLVL